MERHQAVLIVGPTGSGKTPLGRLLEEHGLWGRPCRHFDFGSQLRRAAENGGADAGLTADELDVVRDVLDRAALLENEHFHIAAKILRSFIAAEPSGAGMVVLNGLPRHIGQARDIDAIVDIVLVVYLSCPHHIGMARIQTDAGGDRYDRIDDRAESVIRKQQRFQRRTAPLIDRYRKLGATTRKFNVTVDTTAEELSEALNRLEPHDARADAAGRDVRGPSRGHW